MTLLHDALSHVTLSIYSLDFRKCRCQIKTRMRLCHFDNIQNETQWYTVLLEVDCKGHERFMVRGSPRVGCKIQVAFVFLEIAILWRVRAKTIRTSRVTVDTDGTGTLRNPADDFGSITSGLGWGIIQYGERTLSPFWYAACVNLQETEPRKHSSFGLQH